MEYVERIFGLPNPEESGDDRHRYRWANRVAAVLAIVVGVGSGLLLILEGVPPEGGVTLTVSTEVHAVTTDGCAKGCTEPDSTDGETTVTKSAPSEAGGQAILEKALDNNAGVTVVRILFALLAAFTTAVVVRSIGAGLVDGWGNGHSGPPAKLPPDGNDKSGDDAKSKIEEANLTSAEAAEKAVAATESAPAHKRERFEL